MNNRYSLFCVSLASCLALLGVPAQANSTINSTVRGGVPPQKQSQKAPAQTAATPSKKLEPKPVFSDEDRKQIDDMAQKLTPEARTDLNKLSDSMHLEDRAVYNELRDDEEGSLSDVGMLWQAAVERSGTIRYAIEKLSRRDATGKPVDADGFTKRALQNLVHLGGVAGSMWTGTPAGLIGSNMIQDIMSGNPQDSALSRVTDADMVLLAKEVESLQSDVIQRYYNYKHAKERLDLAEEANATIARYLDHVDVSPKVQSNQALQSLMQSLCDSTYQDAQNARQAYNSAKSSLMEKVGPDAITALEDSKNKSKASAE